MAYNSVNSANVSLTLQQGCKLKIVSFNLHGLNQGKSAIVELIETCSPDIILVQEHWLTNANLHKLDVFDGYYMFGSSAMSDVVANGPLFGRPFGGVAALICKSLSNVCESLFCCDRFLVLKCYDCIIINVYMPAQGTPDRFTLYDNMLLEIEVWRGMYPTADFLIAGDLNIDLAADDQFSRCVGNFCNRVGIVNGYTAVRARHFFSYDNVALGHYSLLDYFLFNRVSSIVDIGVLDLVCNFSDHYPVFIEIYVTAPLSDRAEGLQSKRSCVFNNVLRWDHADVISYYDWSAKQLEPIIERLGSVYRERQCLGHDEVKSVVQDVVGDLSRVLVSGSDLFVPRIRKHALKFWWDQELSDLKSASVSSDRLWKAANKPKSGAPFQQRQQARAAYRLRLRQSDTLYRDYYSNALNDALADKDPQSFWRCWRSKFGDGRSNLVVEGTTDEYILVNKFRNFFADLVKPNSPDTAKQLNATCTVKLSEYYGNDDKYDDVIDINTVSFALDQLKRGKAADIDGLQAEHLIFCHPAIGGLLVQLFNLILYYSVIPESFCASYTVPLPKVKDCHARSLTCADFRGIAINSILAKTFEHCLLRKFSSDFVTNLRQFGFKKGRGCSDAIYAARSIVNVYVDGGSTVNLLALDISKAFDKVNHSALFIKLMKRNFHPALVKLLVNWLPVCITCIRWGDCTLPRLCWMWGCVKAQY
jgi:hypothetical protein